MIVGVTGGRKFKGSGVVRGAMEAVIDRTGEPITELVVGDASGADELARAWAAQNHILITALVADWITYGKAAGPIRNQRIVAILKAEKGCLVAFRGGRGTDNCKLQAYRAGVPVIIVDDITTPGLVEVDFPQGLAG